MQNTSYTQVPNIVFDEYVKELTASELKVLLVIIRQTIGYTTKRKERKITDWITNSFFIEKTNLSAKSVSCAIQSLINKGLLIAIDKKGTELYTPQERRAKHKIYYAFKPYYLNKERERMVAELSNRFRV